MLGESDRLSGEIEEREKLSSPHAILKYIVDKRIDQNVRKIKG
jgi:hypothetical protein